MSKIASKPTVLDQIEGPAACEMCGTPGLKTALVRNPFIYGVGCNAVELSADIPVHTCASCTVSFTGQAAAIIEHDVVCRHLGVLTPKEIRALRARHKMSRAAFARLTGFGEATLARWERREVIQNTSSDRYLRLLHHCVNVDRLRSSANQESLSGRAAAVGTRASIRLVRLSPELEGTYRRKATGWSPRSAVA